MAEHDPEIIFQHRGAAGDDPEMDAYDAPEVGPAGGDAGDAPYGVDPQQHDTDESENDTDEEVEDAFVNRHRAGRTPPARRAAPRKHFNMKPESYNGTQDWESYLSHFEDCAELSGWDDKTKRLVLSASLKGQARTYYMGLPPCDRASYRHLVGALNRRFGSEHQKEVWVAQLEGRRRSPGESMSTLADDLRRMASRAYSDLGERAQEALAMKQLYKLIPFDLKYECIKRNCDTLYEAVAVVEQYEALVGDRKKPVRAAQQAPEKDVNAEVLQRLSRLEQAVQANRSESTRQSRSASTSRQGSGCWRCGSLEHFMRECPQPASCHYCGKQGHVRRDCPDLPRRSQEQQGNGTPPMQ